MNVALVAAMAANRVIGYNGQMPWHLPEELKYFKELTMGKPIVMGRRTFQSIGRPLPGRQNIIVSRSAPVLPEPITVVRSPEQALRAAWPGKEIMVIGGGEIYQAFMPLATRLYLTEIELQTQGDTWFPEFNAGDWEATLLRDQPAHANNPLAFKAWRYDLKQAGDQV